MSSGLGAFVGFVTVTISIKFRLKTSDKTLPCTAVDSFELWLHENF